MCVLSVQSMHYYVTAGQLSIDDLETVRSATQDAHSKWFNLGINLGLTTDTLEVIQDRYAGSPNGCFPATLSQWLKEDPRPTWSTLAKALRSPSVNMNHLAEQILEQYAPIHGKSACTVYSRSLTLE